MLEPYTHYNMPSSIVCMKAHGSLAQLFSSLTSQYPPSMLLADSDTCMRIPDASFVLLVELTVYLVSMLHCLGPICR